MSGRKRVTIDESRWLQLEKESRQLKQIQQDLPSLLKEVKNQTRADLERVANELEARQGVVEQTAATLSEQTRELEADTNRRLRQQARVFDERLLQTASGLREETRVALADQTKELRSEIADLRRRSREEMNRLAGQVGELTLHADRADAAARTWVADARAMHDLIRDAMPHERFAAGELARLERRLVTAEQNVAEGSAEAAIAGAQETYHSLSDLRLDIELREREQILARAAATEALLLVAALANENADREVHDADGKIISRVRLDVDHWSGGELSRLRETVADLLATVRSQDDPMPTERLTEVTQRDVPAFQQRLGEVVERAGIRQLSSQLRVNVADVVVQTLHDVAGYELEDSTYEGEDQREAFFAKLAHMNGNEIVVEVAPSSDDSGRFALRLLSYDYDTSSEAELAERADVVAQGLREQGLNATAPEAEQGVPEESLRDLAPLRAAMRETVTQRAPS